MKRKASRLIVCQYIPEHLVFDHILPRLPVESLIRFKSVSKNWLSTISSNDFTKTHLKFSSSHHQFLLCDRRRNESSSNYSLLPYSSSSRDIEDVVIELPFHTNACIFSVGSCNGLVCSVGLEDGPKVSCFYLWNPATRICRDIEYPCNSPSWMYGYGFGYISTLDDYKIVAIVGKDKSLEWHVFSTRAGCWRICATYECENVNRRPSVYEGVLMGETLYWAMEINLANQKSKLTNYIIGFDLLNEQVCKYAGVNGVWDECKLYPYKGSLSMRCSSSPPYFHTEYWVLTKADDRTFWQKLFRVDHHYILFLGFSVTGKCLVQHYEEYKLVDFCKEALEDCRDWMCSSDLFVNARDYVESLITPFGSIDSSCFDQTRDD